jgi:hypothetical protein
MKIADDEYENHLNSLERITDDMFVAITSLKVVIHVDG